MLNIVHASSLPISFYDTQHQSNKDQGTETVVLICELRIKHLDYLVVRNASTEQVIFIPQISNLLQKWTGHLRFENTVLKYLH